MCEWLSRSEWCDVNLLCRGRIFSAHRAVLASASTFLRNLFLSCPEEDDATVVVLPDFDLEVVFSVLFYVYNGEVVVSRMKMDQFLDVIITLQIFIDQNILSDLEENMHEYRYKIRTIKHYSKSSIANVNVKYAFKLKGDKMVLVTRSRGNESRYPRQGSVDDLDVSGGQLVCNQRAYLENIQSHHGGRQKASYLRGSFIETYPRNGNVNGLPACVPAILNQHYLETTSAVLMHANVKYTKASEASLVAAKRQTTTPNTSVSSSSIDVFKIDTHVTPQQIKTCDSLRSYKKPTSDLVMNSLVLEPNKQEDISAADSFLDLSSLNFVTKEVIKSKENKKLNGFLNDEKCNTFSTRNKDISNNTKSTSSKVSIANHVMQNPWIPRLPIINKPFRRKHIGQNIQEGKYGEDVNDDNNNTEVSLMSVNKSADPIRSNEVLKVNIQTGPNMLSNSNPDANTTPPDRNECNTCNKVFPNKESLAAHSRCHSSNARFSCNECAKTFSQLRNYKYHMSVHRGTREFAATCTVCGKYFNDRGYLSSHMKIHRNRKEYKCQICPKSFNQRVAYNMHVRIHTGVKPHVCAECGKAFSRKMLLKQHQRTHSGERPYACPHCDKRFADRSNMTLHLRLHTGVKPFSCSMCPKSFTKKHHLKSHLNYHTGAKPYSCPRCKLSFTQSSNMRTHYKKCTKDYEDNSQDEGTATITSLEKDC